MYLLAQLPADQLALQIKNGLILLVLGMAIVFVFLTILVFSTKIVSKIVRKFEKSTVVAKPAVQAVASAAPVSNDAEVAVAIAAAYAKAKK